MALGQRLSRSSIKLAVWIKSSASASTRNNRGKPGIISTGASRNTLRYYESLGLISALRRDNNYRECSPQPSTT
jgi:hypothetical protein